MRLKENSLALLETHDSLDLNSAVVTGLYTCPAGMECFVTKVVLRKVDPAILTTVRLSFGWDALAVNVVALTGAGALTTDTTEYMDFIIIADYPVRGVAADIFSVDVETAEGGARTGSVDVFGYLVPV